MRIMSRELDHYRLELHVTWENISIQRLRRRVGGGWYVRDYESFPWPWTYVS